MKQLAKKVYKKLNYEVTNLKKDYSVRCSLKKNLKKINEERNIRIVFIVQMPEIWDKQSSVYEAFLERNDVDVSLIVVPSYDFDLGKVKTEYGIEKEFFCNKYENVILYLGNEEVIDFSNGIYDYVFYQRPYDIYLPDKLQSCNTVKYAKVCYIPYGYQGAEVFSAGNTNKDFFRNVYLGFLDSDEMAEKLCKKFSRNCKHGYQKFLHLGYPVFERYIKKESPYYGKRILWTPRWSYDKACGGSHFLEYKDEWINIKQEFSQVELTMRPHPLMFQNFIKEKRMTETQVQEYLEKMQEQGILLDDKMMIEDTFDNTDILITDFSSIIIMFFMTGKPIIYCPLHTKLNATFEKIMEGIYIAENWSQLEQHLKDILSGNDYLKDRRREIIKEEFSKSLAATEAIVNYIVDDYNAQK